MRLPSMLLLVFAACTPPAPVQVAPPPAAGPDITFFIHVANQLPLEGIGGVRVTGITGDGRRVELGQTFGGKLTVRKDRLRSDGVHALLFCHDAYGCLAYDLAADAGNPSPDLLDYDEYKMEMTLRPAY